MKPILNKILPFKPLLSMVLLATLWVNAIAKTNDSQDQKRITDGFKINKDATIEITNKYGNVMVSTWNKDSVYFDITIQCTHNNDEIVRDLLDNTLVRFTDTKGFVSATTYFNDESSAILSGLSKISDIISNRGKNNLTINYTVKIPAGVSLNVDNKFGNVHVPDLPGNARIRQSYGDIRLSNYSGYMDAYIEFGDFNAQALERISLTANFADVIIYEVQNADFSTKSSKINIQKGNRLRCRSKRDDYTIYQLSSIYSQSSYTDYVITELGSNLSISAEYGNITVHGVKAGFDKVNINSKHCNAHLSFDKGSAFQLDIHLEKGDFAYPQNTGKIEEKTTGENTKTFYGTMGSNKSPSSSLEIFGEDTDVNLTIK